MSIFALIFILTLQPVTAQSAGSDASTLPSDLQSIISQQMTLDTLQAQCQTVKQTVTQTLQKSTENTKDNPLGLLRAIPDDTQSAITTVGASENAYHIAMIFLYADFKHLYNIYEHTKIKPPYTNSVLLGKALATFRYNAILRKLYPLLTMYSVAKQLDMTICYFLKKPTDLTSLANLKLLKHHYLTLILESPIAKTPNLNRLSSSINMAKNALMNILMTEEFQTSFFTASPRFFDALSEKLSTLSTLPPQESLTLAEATYKVIFLTSLRKTPPSVIIPSVLNALCDPGPPYQQNTAFPLLAKTESFTQELGLTGATDKSVLLQNAHRAFAAKLPLNDPCIQWYIEKKAYQWKEQNAFCSRWSAPFPMIKIFQTDILFFMPVVANITDQYVLYAGLFEDTEESL